MSGNQYNNNHKGLDNLDRLNVHFKFSKGDPAKIISSFIFSVIGRRVWLNLPDCWNSKSNQNYWNY